jgi:hypothetical protein
MQPHEWLMQAKLQSLSSGSHGVFFNVHPNAATQTAQVCSRPAAALSQHTG